MKEKEKYSYKGTLTTFLNYLDRDNETTPKESECYKVYLELRRQVVETQLSCTKYMYLINSQKERKALKGGE